MLARPTSTEKIKMMDKANSVIILCLGDKVLIEVAKDKIVAAMWGKLELLYMTKSLAHMLCLKQQCYSFRMVENKSIVEQLTNFYKIIDDLENIEVRIYDEDNILLLLSSLLISFKHFNYAFFLW